MKQQKPKIVGFRGVMVPGSDDREITHVELSDGRVIPVAEVSPRMWSEAGMKPQDMREHS